MDKFYLVKNNLDKKFLEQKKIINEVGSDYIQQN
jgi:hypothetical protein